MRFLALRAMVSTCFKVDNIALNLGDPEGVFAGRLQGNSPSARSPTAR